MSNEMKFLQSLSNLFAAKIYITPARLREKKVSNKSGSSYRNESFFAASLIIIWMMFCVQRGDVWCERLRGFFLLLSDELILK